MGGKIFELVQKGEGIIFVNNTIEEEIFNTKDRLDGLRESKKEKITHIVRIAIPGAVLSLEGGEELHKEYADLQEKMKNAKKVM